MKRILISLALSVMTSSAAWAQMGMGGSSVLDLEPPDWMVAWSPLRPAGDVIHRFPHAPTTVVLLTAYPEVGLLWSAGIPGALPFEVRTHRTEFRGVRHGDSGAYRRPLDASESAATGVSALSWRRLGRRGAVIGRAGFDSETLDPGSLSHFQTPYTTTPLVPSDTSRPRVRRGRARLEGGAGWQLGGWGFGLAVGYEALDNRTRRAGLPRIGRAATFGLSTGLVRTIGGADRVRVAAYGRLRRRAETILIVSNPATGEVYEFAGYADPQPIPINSNVGPYRRRVIRDGWAGGAAASWTWAGAAWTVFGERSGLSEAQSSQLSNDPPRDRWSSSGYTVGGALQRPVRDGRAMVTARAYRTSLEGHAERADLPGVIFREETIDQFGAIELRVPPLSGWGGALALSAGMDQRVARDNVAEFGAGVRSRWGGAAFEIARSVAPDVAVSAGYAISRYWGRGVFADSSVTGPQYERVIAPELALHATDATAWAGTVAVRWRVRVGSELVVRAGYGEVAPASDSVPLRPEGNRRSWAVSLGWVGVGGSLERRGEAPWREPGLASSS